MKRRFTTILAGVLAGNTAFFATQAIATQEMQPTMQATDRYMIIDLAGIPLDQAQNNVDALIPDDTQLTEDSSSLSEQDELEMSTELADQSESSVSEETLPYYLSLSSVDAAKVAYFDKLDELESNLSQTDPDIAGTLTYAVSDIHAGEPMISYLLDQYAGYDTYSAVEFCEVASLQQADESGMYRLLLHQEEGADVVHYSMADGTLQKVAVDSFVNEYGAPAVSLDANTNHWLIVHLTQRCLHQTNQVQPLKTKKKPTKQPPGHWKEKWMRILLKQHHKMSQRQTRQNHQNHRKNRLLNQQPSQRQKHLKQPSLLRRNRLKPQKHRRQLLQ